VNEYSPAFERFWRAYPRRVGKNAAWERWRAMRPPLATVLAAIRVQLTHGTPLDDWPHPATYLFQRRWEMYR
jgi:hypothetical protein